MSIKAIHAPLEIAGQVGLICEFLNRRGIESVGYNFFPTYLEYNKVINTDSYELMKILEFAVPKYDIFHFHNGFTFLDDYRDLSMIADAGKKIIMHHRGNDVRSRARASRWNGYHNPYVNAECSVPDQDIDRNLRIFAKHASAAIVQDYELHPYVVDYYEAEGKPVYVLPRLFDINGRRSLGTNPAPKTASGEPPLIVHAPTLREFKGTASIIDTIERLRKEVPLRFQLVEGVSQAKAFEIYENADIVIDQVLCGAYGNLSVEAMALGKPVVCYIRDDLLHKYPSDLPIVSCHPDNLYDGLKALLKDKELRLKLGQQGVKYVANHHDAGKVVSQLISLYDKVMRGDKGLG